jgi:hypothetical protein
MVVLVMTGDLKTQLTDASLEGVEEAIRQMLSGERVSINCDYNPNRKGN